MLALFEFYAEFTDEGGRPINGSKVNIDDAINPRAEFLERDPGSAKGNVPHISTRAKGGALDAKNTGDQLKKKASAVETAQKAKEAASAAKTKAADAQRAAGNNLEKRNAANAAMKAAKALETSADAAMERAKEDAKKPPKDWDDLILTLRRKLDKDGKPLKRNEAASIDDSDGKGGKDPAKAAKKKAAEERDKAVNARADALTKAGVYDVGHYEK